MRTFLHLLALIWGAALVYRGLATGLPSPVTAYEWGSVIGFGFGALLALVGLWHLWGRTTDSDAALGGRTALLLVALAVAATAAAVTWRGPARGPSPDCGAVIHHVQTIAFAVDPSPESRARFEQARPLFVRSCRQMTSEQRRCVMAATSGEGIKRCD